MSSWGVGARGGCGDARAGEDEDEEDGVEAAAAEAGRGGRSSGTLGDDDDGGGGDMDRVKEQRSKRRPGSGTSHIQPFRTD